METRDAQTKGQRTRARMVESMLELIQHRGYSGTGLTAVTEHAGAPKGSLYFHFPEGKESLGEAAVELAAQRFGALVAEASDTADEPGDLVRRVIDVLADTLTDSDFLLGCPVSAVTLDAGGQSERLRTACADAFDAWIAAVADLLRAHGHSAPRARVLATTLVSTVEGAIIVSRAQRSVEPLRSAADVIADLLDGPADPESSR